MSDDEGRVGTWDEVAIGDVVVGRDRQPWAVTDRVGSEVTLEREGRDPFTGSPPADGPVRILSSAADMALAETLVAIHLEGETIARKDAQGRYTTPVEFESPASLGSHLFLFHGRPLHELSDVLSTLTTEHERLHTPEGKATLTYLDHVHTPDFHPPLTRETV